MQTFSFPDFSASYGGPTLGVSPRGPFSKPERLQDVFPGRTPCLRLLVHTTEVRSIYEKEPVPHRHPFSFEPRTILRLRG